MTLPWLGDPQISVVIVSWNTRDYLESCLRSIFNDSITSECEIWVVDNASTDDSAEMTRNYFPEVRLIENPENLGFAEANNMAIPQANGRYILFLNPDTEIIAGAIGRLERFLDEHPVAGAVGPMTLNSDDTIQTSAYPAPTLIREFRRLFHLEWLAGDRDYRMHTWDQRRAREVEVLQGSCLMIRREALDQIGLMDNDFFMYSEEVDLCTRLRRAGWALYWNPNARVVHHGGKSTGQAPADMFLKLYQSKVLYFRKHYGMLAARIYKLLLLVAAIARLVASPLAWLEPQPIRGRHTALATQYRRLLLALPEW